MTATGAHPGDSFLALLVNVLIYTTVIAAVALVTGRLLSKNGALRHAVLAGGLGCLLLTPLAALLPRWSGLSVAAVSLSPAPRPRPESPARVEAAVPVVTTSSGSVAPRPAPITLFGGEAPSPTAPSPEADPGERRWKLLGAVRVGLTTAACLWALGALVGSVRLASSWFALRGWLRQSVRLDAGVLAHARSEVRRILGDSELAPVVACRHIRTPFAAGLRRPTIVVPSGLVDSLSKDEIADVLLHEMAHIVRRDPWVVLLQRVAAILVWPHPLVHYLNDALEGAREDVCDNFVLRRTQAASYSRTLLKLAEWKSPAAPVPLGTGLLPGRRKLEDRIARLLDRRRRTMTRLPVVTALAVPSAFLVLALTVSGAGVRAEWTASEDKTGGDPPPAANTPETGKGVAGATPERPPQEKDALDKPTEPAKVANEIDRLVLEQLVGRDFDGEGDLDVLLGRPRSDDVRRRFREWLLAPPPTGGPPGLAKLFTGEDHHALYSRLLLRDGSCGQCHAGKTGLSPREYDTVLSWITGREGDPLGAEFAPADNVLRSQLRLPAGQGIVVTRVDENGAAARAGLEVHDAIVAVGDQPVFTAVDLTNAWSWARESELTLEVIRGGRGLVLSLPTDASRRQAEREAMKSLNYWIGVRVEEVSANVLPQLKLSGRRAFISHVYQNSPAARSGIRLHDILVEGTPVDGASVPIHTVDDVRALLDTAAGKPIALTVLRGGRPLVLSVSPDRVDTAMPDEDP